jgi:predicted dehydrogenase
MSEQPFRWGILSTGGIAQQFTRDVQRLPDHKVVAVGSRTQAKADEFGDMFHVPNRHASYESLLQLTTQCISGTQFWPLMLENLFCVRSLLQ